MHSLHVDEDVVYSDACVQVYMTSPMFKWNKWADGVVDQIDTQSGDITVRCSKDGHCSDCCS